jgi:hypothetical protein
MGWNDHVDFQLHDAIEDAVDAGWLEEGTAAYALRNR